MTRIEKIEKPSVTLTGARVISKKMPRTATLALLALAQLPAALADVPSRSSAVFVDRIPTEARPSAPRKRDRFRGGIGERRSARDRGAHRARDRSPRRRPDPAPDRQGAHRAATAWGALASTASDPAARQKGGARPARRRKARERRREAGPERAAGRGARAPPGVRSGGGRGRGRPRAARPSSVSLPARPTARRRRRTRTGTSSRSAAAASPSRAAARRRRWSASR